LLLGGLLFAVAVIAVLSALAERSLSRELISRANLLTAAAEQTAGRDWTEQQLLSYLRQLGADSPRLTTVALVELRGGRVLAVDGDQRGVSRLDSAALHSLDDWLQPLSQGRANWQSTDRPPSRCHPSNCRANFCKLFQTRI